MNVACLFLIIQILKCIYIAMKLIPIKYFTQYYIYHCFDKSFYSCDEETYLQIKNNENLSQIEHNKTKALLELLSNKRKISSKEIFSFPHFTRDCIIKSLANVPHITLEITEQCNLNCVYCCYGNLYRKIQHNNAGDINRTVNFLKMLLNLRIQNNVNSDLRISFYGGEPLLRFDIIRACVDLSKKMLPNIKIKYAMTTNGVLLDKYKVFLIEHDFDICVSLDGNQENNSYRIFKNGKESFFDVVNCVNSLYKFNPLFFKNNISFSTVLHHKNDVISACRFFHEYDKIPTFSFLSSAGLKTTDKKFAIINSLHDYTDSEIQDFKVNFPTIYKSFLGKSVDSICNWGEDNYPKDLNDVSNNDKFIYPGGSCFLFQNRVFITVNGDILLCEKSLRKYKFGKLSSKGFTIYTDRINSYYKDISSSYSTHCRDCYKCYSCLECYFSEEESIKSKKCFCDRSQAINELTQIIKSID